MVVRVAAALSLAALTALVGCGASTPAPASPAGSQETTVHLSGAAPASPKTPDDERDARSKDGDARAPKKAGFDETPAARVARMLDGGSIDLEELVRTTVPMGVLGGATAVGSGFGGIGGGGLGLGGIGVGGGGTGIGIGGFGTGSSRKEVHLAYPSQVAGQSVVASSLSVLELGDSVTLGVSLESATRVLRERSVVLRGCYEGRLVGAPSLAGALALRIIVDRSGRVVFTRDIGSTLVDPKMLACVVEALDEVYVAVPTGLEIGVIETFMTFARAPTRQSP